MPWKAATLELFNMRSVLLFLGILLTVSAFAQPLPVDPEATDSPHPWRLWEGQSKAAAAERAAKASPRDGMSAQDHYDVHFYDLDLDVDPSAEILTGSVTVKALVTNDDLRQFVLDLDSVHTVSAVREGDAAVEWSHAGDHLVVTLSRDYLLGEEVVVTVDYSGDPSSAGNAFGWDSTGGEPMIWTLSEPYGARTWWPCKDLNDDKADSVDLHIAVPQGMTAASNGLLVGEDATFDRHIFHWESRYPIATYLVSLAVHPYVTYTDWYVSSEGDSLPIENYVVPAYEQEARQGYAVTADMIEAFTEGYGEYPFMDEKYGHAHFPWGGGMEHQTCSSMLYYYYHPGLVAHELAHQWWGDMVTCATFHHIWLNEGFATWSEAYWREQSSGMAAYRDEMDDAEYLGPGTIFVEDPSDFGSIFDGNLSYNKASWVVHMIRGVLGDEDFFAALALYRERFAYSSATTEDLQAVVEEISGRDFEAFFQQWIYGEYYPRYLYNYLITPGDEESLIQLRIEQLQDEAGVFVMPIKLRITSTTGTHWHTVENDRRIQNYSFTVSGIAVLVELDPQKWILRQALGGSATGTPEAPADLALKAYPNPFNPKTTLQLTIPEAGRWRLDLYDAAGRRVRTLLDESLSVGIREVSWDGRDSTGRGAAAGVYFAVAQGSAGRQTTRLVLVR